MKYLWISILFFSLNANAQNTWFKLLSGWKAESSLVKGDTIITFGSGDIGWRNTVHVMYSDLLLGSHFKTDTLDHSIISGDTMTGNQLNSPHCYIYDEQNDEIQVGFSYGDSTAAGYKWRAGIFSLNPFGQLPYDLNVDTFDTHLMRLYEIGGKKYAISLWIKRVPAGGLNNFKLLKLEDGNKTKLIKEVISTKTCGGCHEIFYEELKGDNQNAANLFLSTLDTWDWAGDPNSWQADVTKMDTTGNTIWKCRPNINDSVNTTLLQMVQKPDGNLICAWNNFYHPPHKHPTKDNPYADVNDSATVWFAEIDYSTGKVLWRKNLRQYLYTVKEDTFYAKHQNVFFYDAQLVNGNSIVWAGRRTGTAPHPIYSKYRPVILKTDLTGNPIWYRDYDFYPEDTGDVGMQVYSFTQTPDKGFLLTGEYTNYGGQLTNGEFWQKAAILKLDSFGCLQPGCQKAGGIFEPSHPQQLCRLYPNPANQEINIIFPENQPFNWEIRLTDAMGRSAAAVTASSFRYTLSTAHLSPGIILYNCKI